MTQLFCIAILVPVALQSALAVPLVPWQSSSGGCQNQCNDPFLCASLIAVPFSEVNCAPTGGENDFGTNGDGGTVRDPNNPGTAQPGEIWNNFPNGQPQRENPFGSTGGVIGTVRQPGGTNGAQPDQNPAGSTSNTNDNSFDPWIPRFRNNGCGDPNDNSFNPWIPWPVTGNGFGNPENNSLGPGSPQPVGGNTGDNSSNPWIPGPIGDPFAGASDIALGPWILDQDS
ncbi:hypothetical protein PCASD_09759 [Puccinia coronata f. sp. avenae]|uniref:Uncharacterized protein n=1 Tax=Puccinia coronata f. sp. avenae TaxID=200324 RepID=A0A2N5U6A1_9BASI|nr:hypothetical protein PCASD_09759 [Puccinia coronata f. sp. avenae]